MLECRHEDQLLHSRAAVECAVVEDKAFMFCGKLEKVTIGSTVVMDGKNVFMMKVVDADRIPMECKDMPGHTFEGSGMTLRMVS